MKLADLATLGLILGTIEATGAVATVCKQSSFDATRHQYPQSINFKRLTSTADICEAHKQPAEQRILITGQPAKETRIPINPNA